MDEAIDPADARLEGVRPSQISTDNAVAMTAPDGNPPVLFENIFPATPSGKIELKSDTLATRWGAGALFAEWRERATEGAYPLMLISPASDKRISSTLGSIGGSRKAPPLMMMHPTDAAARGLTAGDVKVWNERGEVILPLQVTEKVPPGVVASEKGAWLSTSPTGQTISALVSADTRADIALGACFNDTRVEVTAV
jgi:anaerobic selenocysteine-containing dehydrogenase